MGFTVNYSDPELTAKAGFGKVATLPFLMDHESRYHDLGSEYLIDRGLGYWNPKTAFQGHRRRRPTPKSIHNYATWLANFLFWAKRRGKSLSNMDYWGDVHAGYQAEMLSGKWSLRNSPLMPGTFNPRVDVACDFLRWLSSKGLRLDFVVPTETRSTRDSTATSSVGHNTKEVEVRQGKVPVPKKDLVMPTIHQVREWLESVGDSWGLARQLACESILLTGLRESEVAGLRVDSLPEGRRDWLISNPDAPTDKQEVIVSVAYGTKGEFFGWDHGDKVGPSGTIRIPLKLALKWHEYRQKYRHKSLALWVAKATNLKEKRLRIDDSVHLFLCERTGKRITQDNIYRAWKNKKQSLPFEQWRPHLGRDWWACMTLLQEVSKLEVIKKLGAHASTQMVRDVSLQIIDLRIRPQLRHTSKQAVESYLVWVSSQFTSPIEIEYDALLTITEDFG
jgi:integrase